MTEATIKQDLVKYLRSCGCVVFRHEDMFAAGVPDLSITTCGATTWLEAKFIRGMWTDDIEKIMRKYKNGMIQLETIRRLDRQAPGRAWISVWFLHNGITQLMLWSPSASYAGDSIILDGKGFNKIQEICI